MIARPAASLVLVRQREAGPEVLMLERPARGFFGGLWMFPGCRVGDVIVGFRSSRLRLRRGQRRRLERSLGWRPRHAGSRAQSSGGRCDQLELRAPDIGFRSWAQVVTATFQWERNVMGRPKTSWERALVTPSIHHLRWLAVHSTLEAMWEAASSTTDGRPVGGWEEDGSLLRVRLPATMRTT